MTVTRAVDQPTARGAAESFTGEAWRQTLAVGEGPAPLHVARVTFAPGARTVWHAHAQGQILLCTAGAGRYQSEGGPLHALAPGDSVVVPAHRRHWHGAAPDSLFVHTSVQAADARGEQATWMEPVAEADYARAPEGSA